MTTINQSLATLVKEGYITDEEALRSAYSERVEYEDYTVCAYYFDAKMNNLDDKTYDKYREAYNAKYNIDTSESLDGTLAVMMYYDTSGHDYFYAIAISAPTYWDSEENFNANMNVNVRKDKLEKYQEMLKNLCERLKEL